MWHLRIRVAKQRGDSSKLWKEVQSTDWKPGGWATEAAALAARPQFKDWVDYEMNQPKRTAQAGSTAARSPATIDMLVRPPHPTRSSDRKRSRLCSFGVKANLNLVGGKVQLNLGVTRVDPEGSLSLDRLFQYHQRSAGAWQRAAKRRKREIEKAHGILSGTDAVTVPSWADLLNEDCRSAAASHANRVSVKKRARPERQFRRDVNDRVQAHLHANIVKCFSRSEKFLPLSRIRKFARKTRAYCRAYRDGKPNSLADVEKLIKVYKSHRSAEVFDKKFCHE
jgi:hypothetical protein